MKSILRQSLMTALFSAVVASGIANGGDHRLDPADVVGVSEANCKQCHPSETTHWQKTSHFNSLDRLKYSGNGKKYADALGITAADLATTSVCADCHGTKKETDGIAMAISGVSCESCHGGAKGWLAAHSDYGLGHEFTTLAALRADRGQETAEHREMRLSTTAAAGMIRPDTLHDLATNCLSCHVVDNEKLVAAGHKAASSFELTSWLNGEVRHNYFVDPEVNADAPSLWMENTESTAAERDRMKFVVGALAQNEMLLRARAKTSNPAIIPQLGGQIAAGSGKLAQINAISGTPETQVVAGKLAPIMGTVFAPLPTDETTYSGLADEVRDQTKLFIQSHDGSTFVGLDGLIKAISPHYSQQFAK